MLFFEDQGIEFTLIPSGKLWNLAFVEHSAQTVCICWSMGLSFSDLEIIGGGESPKLGNWGIPATLLTVQDYGLHCYLLPRASEKQNLTKYILQSRTRNVENVTWNVVLEIVPSSFCSGLRGLRWVQCKFFFFFLKDKNPLRDLWTKYIWWWLEWTDVWSIFTFLWEEVSGSSFFNQNLLV